MKLKTEQKLVTGQELVKQLRSLGEKVKKRMWVASPYIGNPKSVGRILGRKWLDNDDIDVRLLIDKYNTIIHPDTIKSFRNQGRIRSLSGLHAKIYIMDDVALVTSANLTRTAFEKRYEVGILLSKDESKEIRKLYKFWWQKAEHVPQNWEPKKRGSGAKSWNEQGRKLAVLWTLPSESKANNQLPSKKSKLNSPSVKYRATVSAKPDYEGGTMSWDRYVAKLNQDKDLEERINLLEMVNDSFRDEDSKEVHFKDIDYNTRRAIAGFIETNDIWGDKEINCRWFGNTLPNRGFPTEINKNNENISRALDEIPLYKKITKNHYSNFLRYFKKAFPKSRNWVGCASRLLAMKRPDVFVCRNKENREGLKKAFDIKQSDMDFDEYWQLIENIRESEWYKSEPENKKDKKIWKFRSALLDVLYYKNS